MGQNFLVAAAAAACGVNAGVDARVFAQAQDLTLKVLLEERLAA